MLRIFVFFPTQSNKSPRKTAFKHPIEQSIKNRSVRYIFCKRNPTTLKSQLHLCTLGLTFFCGSQPFSTSREQRYYGLIELKPRRLLKIQQWRSWVGEVPSIHLLRLPKNYLIPNLLCHNMEEEGHTSLEVTNHPKADNDNQSRDIPDFSKRKSSRFSFDLDSDYLSRQKVDKAMRNLDLQHRMLEVKHQWKLLRADDNSNSDDSKLTEVAGERRKKSKAV